MLRFCGFALLMVTVYSQSPSFGKCPNVETQPTVDLNKYLGYWYEIAKFPLSFEKGKCIRAQYTPKSNGHVQIFNRAIDNGKQYNATGDAFIPDQSQPGRFKVQFAKGTPYSNYWILHTDYNTYSLVYSCSSLAGIAHLEFAWILSRNLTLPDATVQSLKSELASYKIDISKFTTTDQSGCPL